MARKSRASGTDTDANGDEAAELRLPESRPWVDAIRSAAGRQSVKTSGAGRRPGLWLVAFLAINLLALGIAGGVHGAGFDDCEAMLTDSDRATMAGIAVAAVASSAALALWRLRGRALLVALAAVAFSGFAWWILVSDPQECGDQVSEFDQQRQVAVIPSFEAGAWIPSR